MTLLWQLLWQVFRILKLTTKYINCFLVYNSPDIFRKHTFRLLFKRCFIGVTSLFPGAFIYSYVYFSTKPAYFTAASYIALFTNHSTFKGHSVFALKLCVCFISDLVVALQFSFFIRCFMLLVQTQAKCKEFLFNNLWRVSDREVLLYTFNEYFSTVSFRFYCMFRRAKWFFSFCCLFALCVVYVFFWRNSTIFTTVS